MVAIVVSKAVRTLKAPARAQLSDDRAQLLDDHTSQGSQPSKGEAKNVQEIPANEAKDTENASGAVRPPSRAKAIDLSDDAQLAAYIEQIRSDGDLGMPKLARELMGAETAMYGFLARTVSQSASSFVTDLVKDVNYDNSRAEKLIFGHALNFRMLESKAEFRHVPNAGVTKRNAIELANILLEIGHFQTTVVSEDAERELIANVIYFLSALLTDLALSLGFSVGDGRFDSEFIDRGSQGFDQLRPRFQLMGSGLFADIDLKVVEKELQTLPTSLKVAFIGRKDLLRLVLLLALDFTYGFYWFCEARILGRRLQPRLTRPARPELVGHSGPIKHKPKGNILSSLFRFNLTSVLPDFFQ